MPAGIPVWAGASAVRLVQPVSRPVGGVHLSRFRSRVDSNECGPHPVAQDYHIVTMSLGADGGARPGEEPLPVDRRVPAVRFSKEGQP